MTLPPPPVPKAGSAPTDAVDFNNKLGFLLKSFLTVKAQVNQWQEWQVGINLSDAYGFSDDDNTLVKSAIAGLDSELDAVDMTFINRLAGP